MSSLKTLGLAAAIGLSPTCQKPVEPLERLASPPKQEVVSACQRLRAAVAKEVALELLIEKMATDPVPFSDAALKDVHAALKDVHAEGMAVASEIEDKAACIETVEDRNR